MADTCAFSRWKMYLPFWWALGTPLDVLITVAFGYCFDFSEPPPNVEISSGELSEDAYQELIKRVEDFRLHPCPANFPKVVMPLFEVDSSGKIRLIHDCRLINLFLEAPTFSLPKAEDPLRFLEWADFMFIMDFTGFWSQVPVCSKSRQYFCASVEIKGQTRYFTYTGGSFGNRVLPYLAMHMLRHVFNVFTYFFKAVRYIDDVCGRFAGATDPTSTFFRTSAAIDRFFDLLGIRRNNKTYIAAKLRAEFLGKGLSAIDLSTLPLVKKVLEWASRLQKVVKTGSASLRELSSVFGKFISLTNPSLTSLGQGLFDAVAYCATRAVPGGDKYAFWEKQRVLSPVVVNQFLLWVDEVTAVFVNYPTSFCPVAEVTLFTDASEKQMGAVLAAQRLPGGGSLVDAMTVSRPSEAQVSPGLPQALSPSSTVRELWAILLSLWWAASKSELPNRQLLFRLWTDSSSAVVLLRSRRSSKRVIHDVLLKITDFLQKFDHRLVAHFHYRSYPLAQLADRASKLPMFPLLSARGVNFVGSRLGVDLRRTIPLWQNPAQTLVLSLDQVFKRVKGFRGTLFVNFPPGTPDRCIFAWCKLLQQFRGVKMVFCVPPFRYSGWFRQFFSQESQQCTVPLSGYFWRFPKTQLALFPTKSRIFVYKASW